MISIQNYVFPETLEEAYNILKSKRNNTVLGGCSFLRMGSKNIGTAIDLSKINLNYIKECDEIIEIGAMATFREIETCPVLTKYFSGVLSQSVKNIVGVQLRNNVTIGGTVYSKYGFSDLITALLSLDTDVVLYNAGRISLEEFLEKSFEKDILTKIIIPKTNKKSVFKSMRNSSSDYAVLNVAVSKENTDFKIVVGARPQRAKIAKEASIYLGKSKLTDEDIELASNIAVKELNFGSNMRGSKEYREAICKALIKRAVMEVL
ncbi:FAD binding domain-containing protein [Tepidibacter aestuarii]|uniref:FAD binding domain-containing protein n=1 Tax=Tepidibacter aestuarii TaxID=2925782 RepID=UPI0020BFAFC5|nr:FAD binding domain-containing protein [Tepidibacter aestuarii]CAH2212510.1 putative selenate reductase FAD-binding subunit [Tepidibacter aestuarii]